MRNTQVIEYWRKKYLTEAMVVMALAGLAIIVFVSYISYGGFKLLFSFLAVFFAYLMLKELRDDLQTRGENLILGQKDTDFDMLEFDFGRGIDEKKLLELASLPAYQVRECGNVIKSERFILEEDWLYSVISAKFLSFNQTAFMGVILQIDVPDISKNMTGTVEQIGTKIIISGELADELKKVERDFVFEEMLKLFDAKKIKVETVRGQVYFLIKTRKHLFYQFSLLKPCQLHKFVDSVKIWREMAEKLVLLLNS